MRLFRAKACIIPFAVALIEDDEFVGVGGVVRQAALELELVNVPKAFRMACSAITSQSIYSRRCFTHTAGK